MDSESAQSALPMFSCLCMHTCVHSVPGGTQINQPFAPFDYPGQHFCWASNALDLPHVQVCASDSSLIP